MTEQQAEAEAGAETKAEATADTEAKPAEQAPEVASPKPEPAPVSPIAAAEPEPAFVKPKGTFLRGVVDFFRAGMLGASLGMALFGTALLLDKERIIDFDKNVPLGLAFMILPPIILAVARGFPGPARGAARVVGRTFGAILTGGLITTGLILLLVWLDDELRLNDSEVGMFAALGGLALLAVTLLRVRTARRLHRQGQQNPQAVGRPAAVVVERRAGPYFWAGGLAAGLGMWLAATAIAFEASDLLPWSLDNMGPILFLAGVGCLFFAASRGFSTELRRGLPFGSRFFLTLICSLLSALGLLVVILVLGLIFEPSKRETAALVAVLSLMLVGVALWRGRRIAGEGRRGRIEAAALAAVIVGLTLWPQSAWMRYALGSAEGAQTLAAEHFDKEDYARAATFAAVACERGDTRSCLMAAHIHRNGLGVPSSLQQARRLVMRACPSTEECSDLAGDTPQGASRDLVLARACELGDRVACARSQREMLKRRCDARDAFGCRALADSLDESPDPSLNKSWLYQRACSYGDASACPGQPMR